ncbi:MAG TPA: DegV family protein [Gemmatimonadota bacterium]|nr:DegV family protein [Gemmatimonadota bacterium]
MTGPAPAGGIALVTDSTAGLEDLAPGIGCTVVPLALEIDGTLYREGSELSTVAFYGLLTEAGSPPITLPPSTAEFERIYGGLLESHASVLSIHLSGELSQTVAHAREAVARLGAESRVTVVDSRLAGAALGLLCIEARAWLDQGESLERTREAIERIATASRVYFSVYSLDFLYLGGRLERVRGAGSNMAEDRPILSLDGGRLALVERVIGETTRVERTIQLVEREFGAGEALVAAVTHAGERGRVAAENLEVLLRGDGSDVDVRFSKQLGPVLCAHTGFDVCGIAVYPRRLSATAGRDTSGRKG